MSQYINEFGTMIHHKKTPPFSKNGKEYRRIMDAIERQHQRANKSGVRSISPEIMEQIKRELMERKERDRMALEVRL